MTSVSAKFKSDHHI